MHHQTISTLTNGRRVVHDRQSRRPSNKPTEAQIQQTLKDNPRVAETIKIGRLQDRLNDFCEQAVKRVKTAKTEAEFEEIHQALLRALKSACELM